MSGDLQNHFKIRLISDTENIGNNKKLHCRSSLIYTGNDTGFFEYIKGIGKIPIETDARGKKTIELAFVVITFNSIKSDPYRYDCLDTTESFKIITTDGYNGFISFFYNYITQKKLDKQRFPFLEQVKGISYGMLLCCICKALKLGFITSSSTIALEASGLIEGMDETRSMINLVENYRKIGFSEMFPEHYDFGIAQTFVPMIGKVETIISNCTFEKVSKELLAILPVKMCKNICNKENKKVLKSIRKSLIGKDILSEYKDTAIPIEILEEKLNNLKKINKGFVRVSIEDFALMCGERLGGADFERSIIP